MGFWATVWQKIKSIFSWMGRHLLAPIVAVIVIVAAIALLIVGVRDLQIGGLLGRLFGRKDEDPKKAIDIANSIDPDRIDKNGNLIQPGVPDSNGNTQAVVVPIQQPGLFSDPHKVIFTPPGETKPVEVVLPDGVTNKDVEHVVIVKPEVTVVTVKDTSGVSAGQVDDLLKKYGGS